GCEPSDGGHISLAGIRPERIRVEPECRCKKNACRSSEPDAALSLPRCWRMVTGARHVQIFVIPRIRKSLGTHVLRSALDRRRRLLEKWRASPLAGGRNTATGGFARRQPCT